MYFFFFKQKTAYEMRISDWSSDVCSSDLVIMFNRTTGESGTWSVTGENLDGGREIADFLVAAGHDHFAFIAGIENSSTSRDREAGYSQRLLQHGKGKPVREVGNYTFEGATEAARALFKRRSRPDAIFCANDHMALAAIEVARDRKSTRLNSRKSTRLNY